MFSPLLWVRRGLSKASIAAAGVILLGNPAQPYAKPPPDFLQHPVTVSGIVTDDLELTTPLELDVASGAELVMTGQLSGQLPGRLGLLKTGDGILTLTGDNRNLDTGVAIRSGTLRIQGDQAAGFAMNTLEMNAGTTLDYADGANLRNMLQVGAANPLGPEVTLQVSAGVAVQSGWLNPEDGALMVKRGAGALQLDSFMMMPQGRLDVAQGGILLNHSFHGHILIRDGAWLAGGGTLGHAAVNAGGVLLPGGWPDAADARLAYSHATRLNVSGSLRLEPGSRLLVRAWPDGDHDGVSGWGSATLGGHLIVLPQGAAADWLHAVDYVVVDMDAGVTGQFDRVESALPYLEPSLRYSAQQVILTLSPRASGPSRGKGLASGWTASVRGQLMDDSRFLRDAVTESAVRPGGVWVHTIHADARKPAWRGTAPSLDRQISALFLGADTQWRPGLRVGGVAGLSSTRLTGGSQRNGHAPANTTATSWHGGLYVHGAAPRLDWTLGATVSQHRLRHNRMAHAALPNAGHESGLGTAAGFSHEVQGHGHSRTMQVFGKAMLPGWTVSDAAVRVRPFGQFAWIHQRDAGFAEGGGPLAMRFGSARGQVGLTTLGLHAEHEVNWRGNPVHVQAQLGWQTVFGPGRSPHAVQHYKHDVLATRLIASGQPLRQHVADVQLGVQAVLNKSMDVAVGYAGQFAKRLHDHGLRFVLTGRW